MEAMNLQIGNYLQKDNGEIYTVSRLDTTKDVLVAEERGLLTLGYNLEGIPITVEWLKRFGFRKSNAGHYEFEKMNFDFNHLGALRFHWNRKVTYIDHIHQLQNLIFALTGTELTLKNDQTLNN